jgi:hypothetical protein
VPAAFRAGLLVVRNLVLDRPGHELALLLRVLQAFRQREVWIGLDAGCPQLVGD